MKYKTEIMAKYVIANIKIPIEMNPDGTYVSLVNHSMIEIQSCNELPPENGNQLLMIQESINKYLESQTQHLHTSDNLDIEPLEPASGISKVGKNTTFRNYTKSNAHRFTMKRR